MTISIYFDGAVSKSKIGCDMGIGVAIFVNGEYQPELCKFVFYPGNHNSSSNVAEWLGCVNAFKLAKEYKEQGDKIEIYSDSMLIAGQYNGEFQITKPHFREYKDQAQELARQAGLADLQITWVPREKNKEADKLSKTAIKSNLNEA